jgi:hypothetical protein
MRGACGQWRSAQIAAGSLQEVTTEGFDLASLVLSNGVGAASNAFVTGSTANGTTVNAANDHGSSPADAVSAASRVAGSHHVPGTGRAVKKTKWDILDGAIAEFLRT